MEEIINQIDNDINVLRLIPVRVEDLDASGNRIIGVINDLYLVIEKLRKRKEKTEEHQDA